MKYDSIVREDCPLPKGTMVDAYIRDSGHENQERSAKQQRQMIEGYCQKHQLVLRNVYADVRQGTDAEHRVDLNRMLDALTQEFPLRRNLKDRKRWKEGRPFGLISVRSSRLGRDSVETARIKSDLRSRAITIIGLMDTSTGDDATDMIVETIQQWQDEKYIEQLSKDIRRGQTQRVSTRDTDPQFRFHNPNWPTRDGRYLGLLPGKPPTGFAKETIVVGVNRRGELRYAQRLIHDPVTAPLVRLAWEMRRNKMSIAEIHAATRLFNQASGYSRMFQNRIYAGDLMYGGQFYEKFVEPIIPVNWFEDEQDIRQQRSLINSGNSPKSEYHPRRIRSQHLLSGIVRCGTLEIDEHPMRGHVTPRDKRLRRGEWAHYICVVRENSKGVRCSMPAVSARALDRAVLDYLLDSFLTVNVYRPYAAEISKELASHGQDAKAQLVEAEQRLKDTERAVKHLNDAIESGGRLDSILRRLHAREAELTELKGQVIELRQTVAERSVLAIPTDAQIEDWLLSIRAALEGDDVSLARQAIRMMVQKVVVTGKGRAVMHIAPPIFEGATTANTVTHTRRQIYGSRILPVPLKIERLHPAYTPSPAVLEQRREAQRMYAEGMPYSQIARSLGISWQTAYKRVNAENEVDEKLA